eukprot:GHVQ01006125.1.p2 GENE.GHVQ01006125.1~~GHVQ01006125.1.p2  ORF type:complete len:102 (-),score=15.66 GHVQ01006125.1:1328-1633(-)
MLVSMLRVVFTVLVIDEGEPKRTWGRRTCLRICGIAVSVVRSWLPVCVCVCAWCMHGLMHVAPNEAVLLWNLSVFVCMTEWICAVCLPSWYGVHSLCGVCV